MIRSGQDGIGANGCTDAIFACPALVAEKDLSQYTPTYAYEFNDQNAPDRSLPPLGFPYGAAHTFELQYLSDLGDTAYPGTTARSGARSDASPAESWS